MHGSPNTSITHPFSLLSVTLLAASSLVRSLKVIEGEKSEMADGRHDSMEYSPTLPTPGLGRIESKSELSEYN